jgi:anti-anti-sigma factor
MRGSAVQLAAALDAKLIGPVRGQAIVELYGEYDLSTSDAVRGLFTSLEDECELVVVDLSEAEFIDSSFLQNLASADRLARAKGAHFRLQLGAKPFVKRALEISGLLDRLECTSERAEALRRE